MAALSVVAGCGDDDDDEPATVDTGQIEEQIEQRLSTATTRITSVSCPPDVKSETGAKFTCTAKLADGGSAKVQVTETQAPNEFSYGFKPGSVELAGATVDKRLEQELAASGLPGATVNCPDPVKVKADTTVTCPVAGAQGGVGTISFEFTDDSGSIDESSVETES